MKSYHYSAAFGRYWLFVAAAAALAGLIAFAMSQAATPLYTANAKLYFSLSVGGSATDLNQGSNYIQSEMLSYAQLATSQAVLEPVIDELDLKLAPDALADSIEVTTPEHTVILDIAVTRADSGEATRIANSLASSMATAVTDIAPEEVEDGTSVTAKIIAPATEPSQPSSPNTPRNTLGGILIGLILGVLAVVLLERFDPRLRSAEDLAAASSAPLLGVIDRGAAGTRGAPLGAPAVMESFRRLGATVDPGREAQKKISLLITSPTFSERTPMVALGLGAAFAERGRRVLVVDTDIRNPRLAALAGLDNAGGLSTALTADKDSAVAVSRAAQYGFDLLPSGETAAAPGELLASSRLPALLKELSASYDVVLINAAPVNAVADALILGRHTRGTILVVDRARTHRSQLSQAMDALAGSRIEITGVVFNR